MSRIAKLIIAFSMIGGMNTAWAGQPIAQIAEWPTAMQIAYQGDQALLGIHAAMQNQLSGELSALMSKSLTQAARITNAQTDDSLHGAAEKLVASLNPER